MTKKGYIPRIKREKTGCRVCKQILPISEFYTSTSKGYTHLNSDCKKCSRKIAKESARRNIEKTRQTKAKSIAKRKEFYKEYYRERRKKQYYEKPLQRLAMEKARNILITSPCHFCNGTKNLIKHHHDYEKPLDVTILCRSCHNKLHRLIDMHRFTYPSILKQKTEEGKV